MKVIIDPDAFAQSSPGGAVWGTIWIEIEGQCFPEKIWSDMVLVMLRGWLENIHHLVSKDVDQEKLFFMDGPFEVRILKITPDLCELELFRRDNEISLVSNIVSLDELRMAVISASARAASACLHLGIKSRDLDELMKVVKNSRF